MSSGGGSLSLGFIQGGKSLLLSASYLPNTSYSIVTTRRLVLYLPEVLVKVGISNLLKRLHIIHRYEVTVEIHELDANFFKGSLCKEMPLYPGESFMRVIISLF